MYKRILIIGDSGRGKTTFAKKLSEKLSIPTYDTDDFFWKVKFSEISNKEQSILYIQKVYDDQNWIVSGSTRHLIKGGLDKADVIFYLKYNNIFAQFYSLTKRELEKDSPDWKYLFKHIIYVFKKKFVKGFGSWSPPLSEMLEPYKDKVVVLDSFKKINKYIEVTN